MMSVDQLAVETRRPQCLIVSHSYLDPVNRKNLGAQSKLMSLLAVVPRQSGVLLSKRYSYEPSKNEKSLVAALPTFRLSEGQYFFLSLRLAPQGWSPDALVVEYNPWSSVFIQVVLFKLFFYPNAKLICFIKKNTYKKRGRGLRRLLKGFVVDRVLKHVDHFIAGSRLAASMLQRDLGIAGDRISVEQHLGVDVDWFCPNASARSRSLDGDPLVVGYCGRLDDDKGVLELIHSVKEARTHSGRNFQLRLLGSGRLASKIEMLASKEAWLRLMAPVPHDNVVGFLRDLDIFAFPSKCTEDHQEHDSQALLEAMACGLPCIATKVGRNADIALDDAVLGISNSTENGELSNALLMLADDTEYRFALGKRARHAILRKYSMAVVAEQRAATIARIAGKA
jgi:glycosyltransferase involved in cell wall biosynthesis